METPLRLQRLRRLADAATAAHQAWTDARQTRNDEIEAADLDGMGVRAIARETALSPAQVDRIVAARTAHRQAGARALPGG